MDLIIVLGALSGLAIAATLFNLYMWLPLGVMTTLIVVAWEVPEPPTLIYAIGTRITVVDALAGALTVVTIQSIFGGRSQLGPFRSAVLVQIVTTLVSIASGVLVFQVGSAFNEARLVLIPILLLCWSALKCQSEVGRQILIKWMLLTGWLLVAVATYHAILQGIGNADSAAVLSSGDFQTGRILVSGQALFLAFGLFIATSRALRNPTRIDILSVVAFSVVVLLSQHRTVWIATAIGFIAIWAISNRGVKERVVVAGIILGTFVIMLRLTGAGSPLFSLLSDSLSSDKTITEREGSWVQLFAQYTASSAKTLLIGFPFGTGFERVDGNGMTVRFQPHNWYLMLVIRIGAIGLIAWVVMIAASLRTALRTRNQMAVGILVAVSVFGWAYGINWYIGVCVGFAIGEAFRNIDSAPIGDAKLETSDAAANFRKARVKL